MKSSAILSGVVAISLSCALSACTTQEEMAPKPAPAAAAAPAKAKVVKASGDVGLLDTEKNYMILVTKEGKLVTLDFDGKTKVTRLTPNKGKMSDIGLGSSASVNYTQSQEKNIATQVEYRVKKGSN